MTERLHFHFSLWCTGEGNGNLLQYSCLGNPIENEAWQATVHKVSKSRAWLKDQTTKIPFKKVTLYVNYSLHSILHSSFTKCWKWKAKVKSLSRVRLFETPWAVAYQAPPSMGFYRQECWSGLPLSNIRGEFCLKKQKTLIWGPQGKWIIF